MIRSALFGLCGAAVLALPVWADPPAADGDGTAQTQQAQTQAQSQTTPQSAAPAADGAAVAPVVPAPAGPEPVAAPISPTGPRVKIVTTLGTITLALDVEHAPVTVQNFLRYAREGFFNNTVIYRVVPHFVVQMGGVDMSGHGRPHRGPIPLETSSGLKNVRGAVAMARDTKPDTGDTEFFIDLADNSPLDPKAGDKPNTTGYAVFAAVEEGMDVVDAIAKLPTKGGYGPFKDAAPKTPVRILKVIAPPALAAKAKHK